MEIKRGIAVSPGVAIGPALVLDTELYRIPQRFIEPGSYPDEITRLRTALKLAADEARENQRIVSEKIGEQYGGIFQAHALMIEDPGLRTEIESLIRDQGFTAEYAVSRVMRRRAKMLESLNQAYLSARAADIFDLERRILKYLLGRRQEQLHKLKQPVILLAHDLTPSETAELDKQYVLAFATEVGGKTSHTAIMAGVLGIPAVVGVGRFLTEVSGSDQVIVDGNKGLLILDPDVDTLEHYEEARRTFVHFEEELAELRDLPAVTKDGVEITLLGNIEFPEEAAACLERGASGVGLYRTEFLYLGRKEDPTEEEHFQAYSHVVKQMPGKPVVIRTLDLGADKFSSVTDPHSQERNPFLGVRSIRLCLRNLKLFKTQMRAILRASALGDVRIMFPMISTLLELRQSKMILADVMDDLEDEGIPFNRKLPIGTMIEVPSAAIMADRLATEVDFFSLGTNDLIQYTLAADRTNENVASLYNAADPAVLRLIDLVLKAAKNANIPVTVCGEMSGDPIYTLLLLGMGVRQLSATPHNIPEIKKLIRSIEMKEATEVAEQVMRMDTARNITNFLREKARRFLPEAL
ncbi:MAG: phosphoenolpyruvate--protein phosphotransferase [Gemmatales bacterium]|nr:phosphoenolpyruvate--protein phosphotransferase [Gemmatales bacterium]MDW8386650.1 phosphoenolpyruvate--protein phosphotransferase [Gemmatales bacterium]